MAQNEPAARQRWSIAPYFLVDDVVATANYYRDTRGFAYERFWNEPPSFCMVRKSTEGSRMISHYRAVLSLALALGTGTALADAQTSDSSYGGQALSRFVEQIRSDARLPDSVRQMTGGALDSLAIGYFASLDDSSTALYVRTVVAVLHQLPEAQCAAVGGLSGDGVMNLLATLALVDSATVDTLLQVHHLALLAASQKVPHRMGTPEEVRAAISGLVTSLSPLPRERFMSIARHPPPSQSDACWAARTLFGQLVKLPIADLGPVVRRMLLPPPARN